MSISESDARNARSVACAHCCVSRARSARPSRRLRASRAQSAPIPRQRLPRQRPPAQPSADVRRPDTATAAEIDSDPHQPADDAAAEAASSYFRLTHRFARDLGPAASATGRGSLQPRQRRHHRPRISLRPDRHAPGGRAPLDARQDDRDVRPLGRAAAGRRAAGRPRRLVSIEGQNNLRLDPPAGHRRRRSRGRSGTRLVLYATPTYVHNAHTDTLRAAARGARARSGDVEEHRQHDGGDTFFLGLGARLRLLETVSVVAEVSPRAGRLHAGRAAWNVGDREADARARAAAQFRQQLQHHAGHAGARRQSATRSTWDST